MSLYEDKILHKAVEHFGADHQLNKLTEEVGELLVAVAHWRIGKDSANHVAEEIADSFIMLKQAAIILDIEADHLDYFKTFDNIKNEANESLLETNRMNFIKSFLKELRLVQVSHPRKL